MRVGASIMVVAAAGTVLAASFPVKGSPMLDRPVRKLAPLTLAAAVVAMALSPVADAQPTRPAADNRPEIGSPFWGQPDRAERPAPRDRDSDDGRDESFSEAFPTGLAADVPDARERYVTLKWSYQTAKQRLADRNDDLRREFVASDDYRELQREIEQAQADLQEARAAALAPLADDSDYRAAGEVYDNLQDQIRAAHDNGNADPAAIRGQSELALRYANQRAAKERDLIEASTAVRSAQDRLAELGRRQAELETRFEATARNDDRVRQLRDEIENLRIGYLAAGARLDSAVRAANIAADFAYFRAATRDGAGGYAGYGGYGRGYGSPYGYGGGLYGGYGGFYGGGLIYQTITPGRPVVLPRLPGATTVVPGSGVGLNTVVPGSGAGMTTVVPGAGQ